MTAEIHVAIDCPEHEAARYSLEVLLTNTDARLVFHRGIPTELPFDAALITYSAAPIRPSHRRQLMLPASSDLWVEFGKPASLPPSPLPRVALAAIGARPCARLEDPLVLPYVSKTESAGLEAGAIAGAGSTMARVRGLDIVASSFFWISRYEETLIPERDEFGRVPQSLLVAIRERIGARPLVDEYAHLLRIWLERIGVELSEEGPPFRALMTHDVDSGIGVEGFGGNLVAGLRTFYREAIRGRRPRTGLAGLADWTRRAVGMRDEPSVFSDIVRCDAEHGFGSLFFLMANGTNREDATYDLAADRSRRVIRSIRDAGGSIGLHVGLDAHRVDGELRREWELLRSVVPEARPAARSHFLGFFPPETWRRLVDLGIRFDSSVGFSDQPGFRAGTSRAFRPFDVERREIMPMWELPMILMDVNLFRERGESTDMDRIRELIGRVRAHSGCFVVNWHNVSYVGLFRRIYSAILRELSDARPTSLEDLPAGSERVVW